MDFKQAENTFKELKAQFEAGDLTKTEFETQLEKLMFQDEGGSWWMIGYESEQWYRHNGKNWVQVDPSKKLEKATNQESDLEVANETKTDQMWVALGIIIFIIILFMIWIQTW